MTDKELYRKKLEAQLAEWRAELDKLKARADRAEAETKIGMNNELRKLELRIQEGKTKLSELAETSDEAWNSVKSGMESAWNSLTAGFNDAVSKFRDHEKSD